VLTPGVNGFVSGNAAGVVGPWYVFSDGAGPDGLPGDSQCVSVGLFPASVCSQVFTPTPAAPFLPTIGKGMCTSGIAAEVLVGPVGGPSAGQPDYGDLFGVGISLDLDSPGGVGLPYDASAFTGISFDIDTVQPDLRVEFPTAESGGNAPFWNGATGISSPITRGTNVIRWADVGGPFYESNPPPFDVTRLLSIRFHVWTLPSSSTPFSFCIDNLTLLTQ
jgi:hypothetical protein